MTFWDRMTELKNETTLKAKREKREKKIEFKEQLKEFKEKNDVEAIIEIISKAFQESICDLKVLHKVLGMNPEQNNDGAEIWKIADFVRANIADINIEAIVIEEEELNLPVSEVFVDETIVPTDNLESGINNGSGSDYVPAGLVSREQYLLEVLNELKRKGDLIERWYGKNSPEMMRKESYSLWKIPELEKMVLVCDEEGNRTFVINECRAPKKYIRRTKLELKQMENVKNFIWSNVDSWKEQLKEYLIDFESIKFESNGGLIEKTPIGNDYLPRTNENNEIVDEGERYLTVRALHRIEEVCASRGTIKKIINENNIQSVDGKEKGGKVREFYPIEEVKKYTNVNEHLPRVNENNEIVIEGKRYLIVKTLTRLEEVCATATKIKKIIKENNIQSIKGIDKGRKVLDFYLIEEVKKYTNINEYLPRANDNNEIVIEGERYLTVKALGRLEEVSASRGTIKKIINENNIQSIKGIDKGRKVLDFYLIEEVKKYTNINEHLPRANDNNVIVDDGGKKYLTIGSFSTSYEVDVVSNSIIEKIIKENNIQSIKGKDKSGRVLDFYPIEEVKKYTNVNEHLSRANEDNEIVIEGARYLTVNTLGLLEEVCASATTIEKIIKENNIQGLEGITKAGRVLDFYPIKEVKKYTNVNKHLPRVNENNEIVIEGGRYLTIGALDRLEEVSAGDFTIKKIIKENNIQSIKGIGKVGTVRDFYLIEEVKKYTNVNDSLPRANENNEIVIEGERYLTIGALDRLEEVSASRGTIEKIIKENNIQSLEGITKGGRVLDFYPMEEVKKYTNV